MGKVSITTFMEGPGYAQLRRGPRRRLEWMHSTYLAPMKRRNQLVGYAGGPTGQALPSARGWTWTTIETRRAQRDPLRPRRQRRRDHRTHRDQRGRRPVA